MAKLAIGTYVETPYGNGKIEWETTYSVGVYYDIRLYCGQLVKCFHNEVDSINSPA